MEWNKNKFGRVQQKIKTLTEALDQIRQDDNMDQRTIEEKNMRLMLMEEMKIEEIMWK